MGVEVQKVGAILRQLRQPRDEMTMPRQPVGSGYARRRGSKQGDSMATVTLPFGKHRGKPLADIPRSYLSWALNTCDLDPFLAWHVQAELRRRGERFLPAAAVLAELEELLTVAVSEDPGLTHAVAACVSDHVLLAFERLRAMHGIGTETELVIHPRPDPARWARAAG
jgi:hypothetical protein